MCTPIFERTFSVGVYNKKDKLLNTIHLKAACAEQALKDSLKIAGQVADAYSMECEGLSTLLPDDTKSKGFFFNLFNW